MYRKVLEALDRGLYRAGFVHRDARRLILGQLVLAVCSSAAALLLSWGGLWGKAFAVGAALATVNFWWLARFGQHALSNAVGLAGRTIVGSTLRLVGTTVVLYVLIVTVEAPVWAVLAGVSTVLATLVSWGVLKGAGSNRAKEA